MMFTRFNSFVSEYNLESCNLLLQNVCIIICILDGAAQRAAVEPDDGDQPSTSTEGNNENTQPSDAGDDDTVEELVTIPIPITSKTQSTCVVCTKKVKGQCTTVPNQARLQVIYYRVPARKGLQRQDMGPGILWVHSQVEETLH